MQFIESSTSSPPTRKLIIQKVLIYIKKRAINTEWELFGILTGDLVFHRMKVITGWKPLQNHYSGMMKVRAPGFLASLWKILTSKNYSANAGIGSKPINIQT